MSSRNPNSLAKPDGDYYTPDWAIEQCVELVLPMVCERTPKFILEPSAGNGAFLPQLRRAYPVSEITAMDLDKYAVGPKWDCANQHVIGSFIDREHLMRWDLIVGNPPFEQALEFCQQGLEYGNRLVLLVRQGFMSSSKRYKFFSLTPPTHVFLMSTRPSFTGNGKNDSCDYCWVCWGPPLGEVTTLHWLPPRSKGKTHE